MKKVCRKFSIKAQPITPAGFRPFGRVIHYSNKDSKSRHHNLFRVILTERQSAGWRIAYLIIRDKKISRLEQHPASFESFEPVKGRSLLFVARRRHPSAIRCFRLDRPVIVNKGIWHGIITLNKESEVKLTENAQVKCVYWWLPLSTSLDRV